MIMTSNVNFICHILKVNSFNSNVYRFVMNLKLKSRLVLHHVLRYGYIALCVYTMGTRFISILKHGT